MNKGELTLVAFQAAVQSDDIGRQVKVLRRFAGALQQHYSRHHPRNIATTTVPLAQSTALSARGSHTLQKAEKESDDDDDDSDDEDEDSSEEVISESEDDEGPTAPLAAWTDEDMERAAVAEARSALATIGRPPTEAAVGKATGSSAVVSAVGGGCGGAETTVMGPDEEPPFALLEALVVSSPQLSELLSLLERSRGGSKESKELAAPIDELLVGVLHYLRRRRSESPACGTAGALLSRRILKEHLLNTTNTETSNDSGAGNDDNDEEGGATAGGSGGSSGVGGVGSATLVGHLTSGGSFSPPVQAALRVLSALASWSPSVALELARFADLWQHVLQPLANKTQVPGQKPRHAGKGAAVVRAGGGGKGALLKGDGDAKEVGSAAAVGKVTEVVHKKATTSAVGSGPVSARHLYVALVVALLRHGSHRVASELMTPPSPLPSRAAVSSSGSGGKGAGKGKGKGKGGGGGSFHSPPPSAYLGLGCSPLRHALTAAPLVDDDPRTLSSLLPALLALARAHMRRSGGGGFGLSHRVCERCAEGLLHAHCLKRLLAVALRHTVDGVVNDAHRCDALKVVACLLLGSGGTHARPSSSSLPPSSVRSKLQRVLPMVVQDLVQAGVVLGKSDRGEDADPTDTNSSGVASAARDLLLKLLRRDCGGSSVESLDDDGNDDETGVSQGVSGVIRTRKEADSLDTGSDNDEAGSQITERLVSSRVSGALESGWDGGGSGGTAALSSMGRGGLVSVAFASLGQFFAGAWDTSHSAGSAATESGAAAVTRYHLACTTLTWLQLHTPVPKVLPRAVSTFPSSPTALGMHPVSSSPQAVAAAAAAAMAAASSSWDEVAASAHPLLLGSVLPAQVGRLFLSKALQSGDTAVVRQALLLVVATLDRFKLYAQSVLTIAAAASSQPRSLASLVSSVPLAATAGALGAASAALRQRLPELQVLVSLKPKLEPSRKPPSAAAASAGEAAAAVREAAMRDEGDVSNDGDRGDDEYKEQGGMEAGDDYGDSAELYVLLLHALRRFLEVLNDDSAPHTSATALPPQSSTPGTDTDAAAGSIASLTPAAVLSALSLISSASSLEVSVAKGESPMASPPPPPVVLLRLDTLKFVSKYSVPQFTSLPPLLRHELVALLAAVEPKRLRWVPPPQTVAASAVAAATAKGKVGEETGDTSSPDFPLVLLLSCLAGKIDEDCSEDVLPLTRDQSDVEKATRSVAFLAAEKVLKATSLFSPPASPTPQGSWLSMSGRGASLAVPTPCSRALSAEVNAWLDQLAVATTKSEGTDVSCLAVVLPFVRALSEVTHSPLLIVAVHELATNVALVSNQQPDPRPYELFASPVLIAALLSLGATYLDPNTNQSTSPTSPAASSAAPPDIPHTNSPEAPGSCTPSSVRASPLLSRLLGWGRPKLNKGDAGGSGGVSISVATEKQEGAEVMALEGWAKVVCNVCETCIHSSSASHGVALAAVALSLLTLDGGSGGEQDGGDLVGGQRSTPPASALQSSEKRKNKKKQKRGDCAEDPIAEGAPEVALGASTAAKRSITSVPAVGRFVSHLRLLLATNEAHQRKSKPTSGDALETVEEWRARVCNNKAPSFSTHFGELPTLLRDLCSPVKRKRVGGGDEVWYPLTAADDAEGAAAASDCGELVSVLTNILRASPPARLVEAVAAFRSHLNVLLTRLLPRLGDVVPEDEVDFDPFPETRAVKVVFAFVRRLLSLTVEHDRTQGARDGLTRLATAAFFDGDDALANLCGDLSSKLGRVVTGYCAGLLTLLFAAAKVSEEHRTEQVEGATAASNSTIAACDVGSGDNEEEGATSFAPSVCSPGLRIFAGGLLEATLLQAHQPVTLRQAIEEAEFFGTGSSSSSGGSNKVLRLKRSRKKGGNTPYPALVAFAPARVVSSVVAVLPLLIQEVGGKATTSSGSLPSASKRKRREQGGQQQAQQFEDRLSAILCIAQRGGGRTLLSVQGGLTSLAQLWVQLQHIVKTPTLSSSGAAASLPTLLFSATRCALNAHQSASTASSSPASLPVLSSDSTQISLPTTTSSSSSCGGSANEGGSAREAWALMGDCELADAYWLRLKQECAEFHRSPSREEGLGEKQGSGGDAASSCGGLLVLMATTRRKRVLKTLACAVAATLDAAEEEDEDEEGDEGAEGGGVGETTSSMLPSTALLFAVLPLVALLTSSGVDANPADDNGEGNGNDDDEDVEGQDEKGEADVDLTSSSLARRVLELLLPRILASSFAATAHSRVGHANDNDGDAVSRWLAQPNVVKLWRCMLSAGSNPLSTEEDTVMLAGCVRSLAGTAKSQLLIGLRDDDSSGGASKEGSQDGEDGDEEDRKSLLVWLRDWLHDGDGEEEDEDEEDGDRESKGSDDDDDEEEDTLSLLHVVTMEALFAGTDLFFSGRSPPTLTLWLSLLARLLPLAASSADSVSLRPQTAAARRFCVTLLSYPPPSSPPLLSSPRSFLENFTDAVAQGFESMLGGGSHADSSSSSSSSSSTFGQDRDDDDDDDDVRDRRARLLRPHLTLLALLVARCADVLPLIAITASSEDESTATNESSQLFSFGPQDEDGDGKGVGGAAAVSFRSHLLRLRLYSCEPLMSLLSSPAGAVQVFLAAWGQSSLQRVNEAAPEWIAPGSSGENKKQRLALTAAEREVEVAAVRRCGFVRCLMVGANSAKASLAAPPASAFVGTATAQGISPFHPRGGGSAVELPCYGSSLALDDRTRLQLLAVVKRRLRYSLHVDTDLSPWASSSSHASSSSAAASAVSVQPIGGHGSGSGGDGGGLDWAFASMDPLRLAKTLTNCPLDRGVHPNAHRRCGNKSEEDDDEEDEDDAEEEDASEVVEEKGQHWSCRHALIRPNDDQQGSEPYDPAFVLPLFEAALGGARASLLLFLFKHKQRRRGGGDGDGGEVFIKKYLPQSTWLPHLGQDTNSGQEEEGAEGAEEGGAAGGGFIHEKRRVFESAALTAQRACESGALAVALACLSSLRPQVRTAAISVLLHADALFNDFTELQGSAHDSTPPSSTAAGTTKSDPMKGIALILSCRPLMAAVVACALGTVSSAKERQETYEEWSKDQTKEGRRSEEEEEEGGTAAKKAMVVPRLPHTHSLVLAHASLFAAAVSSSSSSSFYYFSSSSSLFASRPTKLKQRNGSSGGGSKGRSSGSNLCPAAAALCYHFSRHSQPSSSSPSSSSTLSSALSLLATPVLSFVLRSPRGLNLSEAPLFNALWTGGAFISSSLGGDTPGEATHPPASSSSSNPHFASSSSSRVRIWLLGILKDGLKTKEDSAVFSRGHVLSLLLSCYAASPSLPSVVDPALRHAILDMKIRACARHFVLHNGAFLFLRAAIANAASTRSSSSADADLMLRLLDLLSVVMSFAAVINEQKEHEEEGEEGEEGEARVEDDDDSVDEGDDEDDKESGQGIDDSENESGNGHGHVRVGTDMSVAAKRRKIATVPAGAAVKRRGGVFNIRHECFLTALCVQSVARSCCPSSQGGSCRGALAAAFVDVLWRAHLIAHDDCSMGAAATTDVIASADIGIPLLLNSLALLRSHFPDPSAVIRMHKTKHSLDYRNGGGGGGDERKRTIADNKAASSTSTLSSMLTLAILTATAIIALPSSSAQTLSENGKRTATAEEEKEGVACRWTVDVVSAAAEMSAHNETLCRSNIDDGGGGGGGFMLLLSQCRDATTRALLRCALNHKHGGDNLLVELPTLLLCHAESRHGNCNFNNSDVVDSSYAHATGTMLTDKERLGALLSQERTQHEVSATVASACVLAVLKYRREGAKLAARTRLRMKSSPALDGGRGLGDGNEGVENEHGNNEEEEDDSAEWAIRSVCSRLGVEYGFDSSRPADVCRSGGGGGSAGVARQISCDSFVNDIVTQLRVVTATDTLSVDGGDGMTGGEMYDDRAAQSGRASSFAEVLAEGALGHGGWVEH